MLKRLAALACSLLILLAIRAISRHEHLAELTQAHIFEIDRHVNYGELLHHALLLLLGLPAAALLTSAWSEDSWQRVASWIERMGYWPPAVGASVASFCISRFVTHQAWFTDDEAAYLFQMELYSHFQLKVPALEPEWLFRHPFTVVGRGQDGGLYWFGLYPIMQPLLMAVSNLLGSPLISQWLCAGGIAYQTGRLAERLTGHRLLGVLAAWLCTTSPMLIGLSATYHTSVLACFLSVCTLRALVTTMDHPMFARGALVGALGGAAFLTRGTEGTLMIIVAGGALLVLLVRHPGRSWPAAVGFGLAGALAFGVYVWVNLGTTGEPLKQAYAAWGEYMGRFFGFGEGLSWGRVHTPLHGLGQTFAALMRLNTWLFGWPISVLAALASLALRPLDKAVIGLSALSAAHLAFYFFINFGSVHDFGSAYHVWHLPWFAVLTAYTLRGIAPLTRYGARMALSMTLVALSAFWPLQLQRWNNVASAVRAPVDGAVAAARGRPAIVLYGNMQPASFNTWVGCPPASYPQSSLWWARDAPGAEQQLRTLYPERVLFRMSWSGDQPMVSELR
jgi:hypothetical protein